MQLEQLGSALQAAGPDAAVRLPFVFAVRFPLWPLLRKELAEFYIAMGFVGECLVTNGYKKGLWFTWRHVFPVCRLYKQV